VLNTILASNISQSDLERVVEPLLSFCKILIPVMLTVVGTVGAIWVILLCVKFSRADDPQEHEKAKKALKNAIIGFVLIFILLIMLNVGVDVFTNWWKSYQTA
jgi:heme O synthase-like polyprenyltransferase